MIVGTVFDGEAEVSDFLANMVSVGWPVFLMIMGGIVGVWLGSRAILAGFRFIRDLITVGDTSYYRAGPVRYKTGGSMRRRGNGL